MVWFVVLLGEWGGVFTEPLAQRDTHTSTRVGVVSKLPKLLHLEKIRALEAGTLMEAMNMLAWDAPIWAFRPFLVG